MGMARPSQHSYTFPALMTTSRFVEAHPEAAAGAVRAIVATQRALRADPSLAGVVARRIFPAYEAEMIPALIARDAEFLDATITEAMVEGASRFAQRMGVLESPASFEDVVTTQYAELWQPGDRA